MSPHIAVRRTLVFVQDTADCCVIVLAEPRQQIQNVSTFGVVHNVATQVFDPVQYHQIGLEQCDFALQYLPPFVGVVPAQSDRAESGMIFIFRPPAQAVYFPSVPCHVFHVLLRVHDQNTIVLAGGL